MRHARSIAPFLIFLLLAAGSGCGRRSAAAYWRLAPDELRPRMTLELAWERPLPFCPSSLSSAGTSTAWFGEGTRTVALRPEDGGEIAGGVPPAPPPPPDPAVETLVDSLAPDVRRGPVLVLEDGIGVFVLPEAGVLQAVDLRQGKLRWSVRTGSGISVAPQPYRDRLLLQSLDNYLYFLRAENGHEMWRARPGGRLIRKAAFWSDRALVIPQSSRTVTALDLFNGSVVAQWSLSQAAMRFTAGPIVVGDLLLAAFQDGAGTHCSGLALQLGEAGA